jgi:OOP family OmpA-OmpF porin
MKNILLPLLLLFCLSLTAQHSCIYEFQNNLLETSGQGPELSTLGRAGNYTEEILPELGGMKRTVYKFDKNCGLNYNMRKSTLNLSDNYSIEIYFKFDALESWKRVIDFKNRTTDNGAYIFNGKLNFYKIATSEIAPVAPGEYTHYTFTYDAASRMVNIYADGIGKISFYDAKNDAQIDANELHFFYDDLIVNNEASSGTVAYIKLFDYTIPPQEAKKNFEELKKTVSEKATTTSVVVNNKAKLDLTIVNAKTLQKTFCTILVRNKQTGALISTLQSTGKTEVELDKGAYLVNIKASGYAETNEEIDIAVSSGVVNKEIQLIPIQIGESVKLENVHFKQGVPELLPEAYPVLNNLVKMLNDNKSMEIELSGHTDNQGDPKLNLKLSEDRVKLIENYLISKGISSKRVTGKGYGGTQPIAPNDKEETRKLNRRVDFKVVKF